MYFVQVSISTMSGGFSLCYRHVLYEPQSGHFIPRKCRGTTFSCKQKEINIIKTGTKQHWKTFLCVCVLVFFFCF